MNLNPVLAAKKRAVVIAIAALVAFVAGAIVADGAKAASSGGVSSPGANTGSRDSGPGKTSAKYDRLWQRVSKRQRRWARRTAKCESGGNPRAIGGGGRYRGAFQFLRSTWRSAPKSPGGDPIRYSYRVQAVVAIALKKRDGAGHWPNCG